jgi:hypothetical protein
MKKTLAIVVVVVLVALFGFGIRVSHPDQGLSSALGSAKSSVAIYKKSGQPEVSSKVIVKTKDSGTGLGIVRGSRAGNVDVDLGATFVRVSQKDVKGNLIVVIPFIGSVLGVVGL